MTINDEVIAAYVDGELAEGETASFEAAMAADPALVRHVAEQRRLRARLQAAFEGTLRETLPERLLQAVHTAPTGSATVTDLTAHRTGQSKTAMAARARWPTWTALAASVAVGAIVGSIITRTPDPGVLAVQNGQLLAQGALRTALDTQLASEQGAAAAIQIGVTFKDRDGHYCRTFTLRETHALGGLACRESDGWSVQAAAPAADAAAGSGLRMAAGSLPESVLLAVEKRQLGDALDAAAERQAAAGGWQTNSR